MLCRILIMLSMCIILAYVCFTTAQLFVIFNKYLFTLFFLPLPLGGSKDFHVAVTMVSL